MRAVLVLAVVAALAAVVVAFVRWGDVKRPVAETDGIKRVSTVRDANLAVYDGTGWQTRFWNGVNLGASEPGYGPGAIPQTREDYLRWFPQMKEMNVDVLRVYTILGPEFYEALEDFNSEQEEPLWLIQGVWSPEEELVGEDGEGRDAYTPEITQTFEDEITDAVRVVHGDADIPERRGHAGGRYRADVSAYVLGWIVGTEWYPLAVEKTDEANAGMEPYAGEYFRATESATPFESWGARMLDVLAREEMEYGWQRPAALSNWPTTDPLTHPDEANEQEDLVSVDPMHIEPTEAWKAGYFASYHIYPAYPDFLRYSREYQSYVTEDGDRDPYAGYLHEMREHHEGIPLVVAEYGTSSARGMAHRGPLGRDQGMHTETAQGEINADLLRTIRNEGYDGAILFAWQDEWFKFAWNTGALEIPGARRPMWLNRLTNEQNYGVIAAEPGESAEEMIHLDGETDDWEDRERGVIGRISAVFSEEPAGISRKLYGDFNLSVTHDAAYLYLLLEKREGTWDLRESPLDVGFGVLPRGATTAERVPGVRFPKGIQFLLRLTGAEDSRLLVNSAYDPHTWQYGYDLKYMPDPTIEPDPRAGVFLPWMLALNRPLDLPQTGREIPFEQYEAGRMEPGITDPSSPEYDSLADWYAEGDVLEVRIPWTFLGFTDPSRLEVWDYPYETNGIEATDSDGIRIYPTTDTGEVSPMFYSWEPWDVPEFHERKKKSYEIMKEAFARNTELRQR